MILRNDIWGDTSVTLIEEIDNQFLIVRELNMLALYSKLNKEQEKALRKVLAVFYEILFSSKDKSRVSDTVPFAPDVSFDDDSITDLKATAQKIAEEDTVVTTLPVSRKAVVSYEVAQLITYGGKDET